MRPTTHRATEQEVLLPDDVEVTKAAEGAFSVTLKTRTHPDYGDRLVVQGELVGDPPAPLLSRDETPSTATAC